VKMMKTAVRWAILLCCALPASRALAQTPQDARITISHPGVQVMKQDLETLLKLTPAPEQKQLTVWYDFVDTFAIGLDPEKPMSIQMLPGINPAGYLAILPLAGGFQDLRENMEALGYEVTRDSRDTSLYQFRLFEELEGGDAPADPAAVEEVGWMRVLAKSGYLVGGIVGSRKDLPALREIVIQSVVPEFESSRVAYFDFTNPDPSPAAQTHRREKYQAIRQPAVDAIRKRPSESDAFLQLRKTATSMMMDEGERVSAESQRLVAQFSIDSSKRDKPVLLASGELQPISGTGLEEAMKTFNTVPDAFAAVAKPAGAALSIRINHPVDPMRQKNLTTLLDLLQQDVSAKLASRPGRTDEQKEAIDKVVTGIVAHLKTGIDSGWLNFCTDAVPDGKDSFNSVTAYTSPAPEALNEVLPLMAKMSPRSEVEMNAATIGDIAVHRVRLEEGLIDVVDRYFGVERDVYVAIGKNIVWMASGEKAMDDLKRVIDSAGEPKPGTSPLHVEVALLPWTRQSVNFFAKVPLPKEKSELELRRAGDRRRTRAVEAFSKGDDTITVHCEFEDGKLKTDVRLDSGILRFIGRQLAVFAEENLATERDRK
jgi:hypothetical protein